MTPQFSNYENILFFSIFTFYVPVRAGILSSSTLLFLCNLCDFIFDQLLNIRFENAICYYAWTI